MDMITRQVTLGSNLKHEGSELWHTAEEERKSMVIEEDQDTVHLGLQMVYIHI